MESYFTRKNKWHKEGQRDGMQFAAHDKLFLQLTRTGPNGRDAAGEDLGPILQLEDQSFAVASNLEMGAFYERWHRHGDLT